MKIHTSTITYGATLLACASQAVAWGVAGHQIVATIAQVHLHPSARQAIAAILPDWTKGHLAPIAAWPDRVRYQYPWSGQLHYVTPMPPEHPPENCAWEGDFKTPLNVLNAIQNYTARVALDKYDIDLRFLVHFLGDVHQPLHLTGRERGGNGDPILFEGRHMSLHGLWDTALLTKTIREFRNYTRPLPSRQIESALMGSIYDPYVRWIIWEGIREWWIKDLPDWLSCSITLNSLHQGGENGQTVLSSAAGGIKSNMYEFVSCPLDWAPEVHAYCCSHVFPQGYNMSAPPVELNTKAYHGKVVDDKVIESLLAKGGLRLAAVLNALLASEEDLQLYGKISSLWITEGAELPSSSSRDWKRW